MPPPLRDEIRQGRPFRSKEEEAFLNVQRTANVHFQALSRFLKPFGVTPTQYNALRILRGSHPTQLRCRDVGDRMVTPVPDVTRLLDRLAGRGWVERTVDQTDRRATLVSISDAGLELVNEIDAPLAAWLRSLLGHMSDAELDQVILQTEKIRYGPE